MDQPNTPDFIDHIDDWIEYLVALLSIITEDQTRAKYERQIKYLLNFRCGANCNIYHNKMLTYCYSTFAQNCDEIYLPGESISENLEQKPMPEDIQIQLNKIAEQADSLGLQKSMSIIPKAPIQKCYLSDNHTYLQITKVLASEDLFFLQGPPGTGKTTAIVEVVLQTLRYKPNARILITSETHVAVDNAIDRLTNWLNEEQMQTVLRYPAFRDTVLENETAYRVQAHNRANALWEQAHQTAPELTDRLWQTLGRGHQSDGSAEKLPRWMIRNLADKHQIIGVTCNQIDHLLDKNSELFDLAIVDECSKATMPEWVMALTVSKKCVLVGDHKQLPPTFCEEESGALSVLDPHREHLIRNGVIDRIFKNFPESRKGTLIKQYRMLPHIGEFISKFFYDGQLLHHRENGNGYFEEFGWLTYEAIDYKVPAKYGDVLVNKLEVKIIVDWLQNMQQQILSPKTENKPQTKVSRWFQNMQQVFSSEQNEIPTKEGKLTKLSIAVITPYRAQCNELKRTLNEHGLSNCDCFNIEVDTVDAFQGRQADVVFFSFVRTTGPATFYADDRRLNVAISRAKDCVYLVGYLKYIKSKHIPALQALSELNVLYTYTVNIN